MAYAYLPSSLLNHVELQLQICLKLITKCNKLQHLFYVDCICLLNYVDAFQNDRHPRFFHFHWLLLICFVLLDFSQDVCSFDYVFKVCEFCLVCQTITKVTWRNKVWSSLFKVNLGAPVQNTKQEVKYQWVRQTKEQLVFRKLMWVTVL